MIYNDLDIIHVPNHYEEQAKEFQKYYSKPSHIVCPDRIPSQLIPRTKRICRFCYKNYPEVSFKSDAHVFPKALGNIFLLSDFECDSCNNAFSKYEDDLMKFIGLSRTISKVRGRKTNPRLVTKDIIAQKDNIFNNSNVIKIFSPSDVKNFEFDATSLTQTIRYTKAPYKPINVFKAFYKMALSCIPEREIGFLTLGCEFLKNDFPFRPKSGFVLHVYRLPLSYQFLSAFLFKTRKKSTEATTYTFILLYDSYMYQIPLPFDRRDFEKPKTLNFPICPPIFDGTGNQKWKHQSQNIIDLSNNDTKSDDIETILLKFNKEEFENSACFDQKTGQLSSSKFDFNNIAGLYLTDEDYSFDPKM